MPGPSSHRLPAFALAMLCIAAAHGQALRINELHPVSEGPGSGWVELLNAGVREVVPDGITLVQGPQRAVVRDARPMAPGEHRVLKVHGKRGDPGELLLDLPAAGGDLLLLDAAGARLLDAFRWPAVPPGVSIGRLPDGSGAWSLMPTPTPGAPNDAPQRIQARAPAPAVRWTVQGPVLDACAGCIVSYTTDGSAPHPGHGRTATGPVVMPAFATLRAVAWRNDLLPSAEVWARDRPGMAGGADLCIDPGELHDPLRGLLSDGPQANPMRTGPGWVRPAHVALPGLADTGAVAIRLRISGSGSRSLPKRSFNLSTVDGNAALPLPDGSLWRTMVLRADATPHALLRNLFAAAAVHRAGDRLDVQPGVPLPLRLNGVPQGCYRLMPAKNEDFLLRRTRAEHLDIMEGPDGHAVKGDRAPYLRMLGLLDRRAPLDSLEELIDVESLIELACFDLYTGRADHDLNMRCWRPAQPGGRWRWVLYDMDLWAPPADPSIGRIADAPWQAAPHLSALLDHPQLRPLLLARLAVLNATVLAPRAAATLADSLFTAHAALIHADRDLWAGRMEAPGPQECLRNLKAHALERPAHLMRLVARYTGAALGAVEVHVPGPKEGRVLLDGIPLAPGVHAVQAFHGAPLTVQALPGPGMRLAGWKGRAETGPLLTADPAAGDVARPVFVRAASGGDGLQ